MSRSVVIMWVGVAAVSSAAEVPPQAEDQPIGLTFEGLFQAKQADWRASGSVSPLSLTSSSSGGEEIEAAGFGWPGDDLGAEDIAWLNGDRSVLEQIGLSVGRSTVLRDGGIDGSASALGSENLASFADGQGEFDLYDIDMQMGAIGDRRVGVDFITGFRAVRGDVARVRLEQSASGGMLETIDEGHGMVAIPVIGTGVHWQPSEVFKLSGEAATHTVDEQGTYYDLIAEAEIRLHPNVGLVAGYQFVRSAMEIRDVPAELSDAGLFARVQIKF